jgi:SAM-dependent methyltransferase
MELNEAMLLLKHPLIENNKHEQYWADLGCGEGLFTKALCYILPSGGTMYAYDLKTPHLPTNINGVNIETGRLDFVKEDLNLFNLHGILMANSIHYVPDKISLLNKLKRSLRPGGFFIFVEYDTDAPVSHWVPYPMSFASLKKIAGELGWQQPGLIATKNSIYRRSALYSAIMAI